MRILGKFLCHAENPIDNLLRVADRRDVPRIDARNIDLVAAHALDHLDLGPLDSRRNRTVRLGNQVRNGDMVVATIRQGAGVASSRLLHHLLTPVLTLLQGQVREDHLGRPREAGIVEPAVLLGRRISISRVLELAGGGTNPDHHERLLPRGRGPRGGCRGTPYLGHEGGHVGKPHDTPFLAFGQSFTLAQSADGLGGRRAAVGVRDEQDVAAGVCESSDVRGDEGRVIVHGRRIAWSRASGEADAGDVQGFDVVAVLSYPVDDGVVDERQRGGGGNNEYREPRHGD